MVDHDHSSFSRRLIRDVTSSNYFRIQYYGENYNEAYEILEKENVDLILEIPPKFEKNIVRESQKKVLVAINAINGTKAGLSGDVSFTNFTRLQQKYLSETLTRNC